MLDGVLYFLGWALLLLRKRADLAQLDILGFGTFCHFRTFDLLTGAWTPLLRRRLFLLLGL